MIALVAAFVAHALCTQPARVEVCRGVCPSAVRVEVVERDAQADCRVRWARWPARAGDWIKVDGSPDMRVVFVSSHPDVRVAFEGAS